MHTLDLEHTLPLSLQAQWGEYENVEASLRLRWEARHLKLRFTVQEPQLRRMVTEHNGHVWEDSCVEAFLQREGQNTYVNVECSASTRLLVGKGENRLGRQLFPPSFIDTIPVGVEILENSNKQSRWRLEVDLDLVALGLVEEAEELPAVSLRGNFYCCGDKLKQPHYLSAAPIGTLKPDFHCPAYFVPIRFQ